MGPQGENAPLPVKSIGGHFATHAPGTDQWQLRIATAHGLNSFRTLFDRLGFVLR